MSEPSPSPDKHWVTKLFPPAYQYTLDDLLSFSPPPPAQNTDEHLADDDDTPEDGTTTTTPATPHGIERGEKQLSTFEAHLAHRIAPEDVAAIKNVYQRVWMMRRHEAQLQQSVAGPESTSDAPYKDAETSTTDLAQYWEEDIWSTAEINILRQVFRQAQQQNAQLLAQIKAKDQDGSVTKQKLGKQNVELSSATTQLHEVKKANKRLQIMCQNLKKGVDEANVKVTELEEDISRLVKERRKNLDVIHKQNVMIDKERIVRKKLEAELQNKNAEMINELKLKEDNLQSMHEQDIAVLQARIVKLEEQLIVEKREHERTHKGLDALRSHFCSLPYAGEMDKRNMVSQDQLTSWTS